MRRDQAWLDFRPGGLGVCVVSPISTVWIDSVWMMNSIGQACLLISLFSGRCRDNGASLCEDPSLSLHERMLVLRLIDDLVLHLQLFVVHIIRSMSLYVLLGGI